MDEITCAVSQEEGDVEDCAVMNEIEHRIAETKRGRVGLGIFRHALADNASACLGINGNDVVTLLNQELQFCLVA